MLLNGLFKRWTYQIFAPGVILRQTYEAFRDLLRHDGHCHGLMAEFELLYHEGRHEDFCRIERRYDAFSREVAGMIQSLERMRPGSTVSLQVYFKKFDFYIRFLLAPPKTDIRPPFVLALEEIEAPEQCGNKAYNLARLRNELRLPVPDGFVITTSAFSYLLEYNDLRSRINGLLAEIDLERPETLTTVSVELMRLIHASELPPDIEQSILRSCDRLASGRGDALRLAVRSSAVSEDSDFSFAGQYRSVLGVRPEEIMTAYRQVLASRYTPEALYYRISLGLRDEETPLGVLVLEQVEAVASGVMYTRDPTGEDTSDDIYIQCIHGLGEPLVGGAVTPDTLVIRRKDGFVCQRKPGQQQVKRVMMGGTVKDCELAGEEKNRCAIDDEEGLLLASWGERIEALYSTPQDIEWARRPDGSLLLLQSRPLQQVMTGKRPGGTRSAVQVEPIVEHGKKAAGGCSWGKVFLLDSHQLEDIPSGAVLVTPDTPPSLVRVMGRLKAVIAERGSRASHFATVAREFGVPFLTGVAGATSRFYPGQVVTVDADQGCVYPGKQEALLLAHEVGASRITPYTRRLKSILSFISPLNLMDPASASFVPEQCRSLHDIIRYVHETGMQIMFGTDRPGSARGTKRLLTEIPLNVFLFDVGGGLAPVDGDEVALDQVLSEPFLALWRGLSAPGVKWQGKPFDWDSYDAIGLAGGVAPSRESFAFGSYSVVGADYLHFNIRFGYHFSLVDCLCGNDRDENYCMVRFAGGGGDYTGRLLRIEFLATVLGRLEFLVERKGDLLEARLHHVGREDLVDRLEVLGRLLAATKLMDMVLRDRQMVGAWVDEFFQGRSSFAGTD